MSNRIVMPAMHLGLANNGEITKKLIDFYVERAKGGAGLLIIGGCYVDIYAKGLPSMIAVDDDKFIPKLKELTDAVHNARDDVKICCQLYHGGACSKWTYHSGPKHLPPNNWQNAHSSICGL